MSSPDADDVSDDMDDDRRARRSSEPSSSRMMGKRSGSFEWMPRTLATMLSMAPAKPSRRAAAI